MDSNSFPNYEVLINGLNPVKWPAPQSLLPENGSIIGTGNVWTNIRTYFRAKRRVTVHSK